MTTSLGIHFFSSSLSPCKLNFDLDDNSLFLEIPAASFSLKLLTYPHVEYCIATQSHSLIFDNSKLKLDQDEVEPLTQLLEKYKRNLRFKTTQSGFLELI